MAIWTFEKMIQATKIPQQGWKTVKQAHGEIGGGNEATISQPFPAKGFFVLPK